MADKVVNFVKKGRRDMWQAFKSGISITGYRHNGNYGYYKLHDSLKMRYPAPGSCALEELNHPNLFKNDWKIPYR